MCCHDYNERYVSQLNPGDGQLIQEAGGAHGNYYNALFLYLKNKPVWLCPDDLPNTNPRLIVEAPNMGYHLNGNVITEKGLLPAAVESPASLMLMRESGVGAVYNIAYLRPFPGKCDDVIGWITPPGAPYKFPRRNGINLLITDSHVKWYTLDATITLSQFPGDPSASALKLHPVAQYCQQRQARGGTRRKLFLFAALNRFMRDDRRADSGQQGMALREVPLAALCGAVFARFFRRFVRDDAHRRRS